MNIKHSPRYIIFKSELDKTHIGLFLFQIDLKPGLVILFSIH